MQLSAHFQLIEFTRSTTAVRRGLSNEPGLEQIEALRALCANVLEPLRELVTNRPIRINSGYRSLAVNQAVGGSRNSQHMVGEAADLTVEGFTPAQVFDLLRVSELPFDQLILEGNWLHISYSRNQRRQQCLVAHFNKSGVSYQSVSRRPATQTLPAPPAVAQAVPVPTLTGPAPSQRQVLIDAPNDEFGTVSAVERYPLRSPSRNLSTPTISSGDNASVVTSVRPTCNVGQRLGVWVDSMDTSRLIGTVSFICTIATGISTTCGHLNPEIAAMVLSVSGAVSAFCGRLQGVKKRQKELAG